MASKLTPWGEYLVKIAGTDNRSQIAARCGRHQGTVSRWFNGQPPAAPVVMEVARCFGANPLLALLAAGHMDPRELPDDIPMRPDVSVLTIADLIEELGRRSAARNASLASVSA